MAESNSETRQIYPERQKIWEDWLKWKDQFLGTPEDKEKAESYFIKIRDGIEPVTAAELTPKQVADLSQDKVIDVRLPKGTVVHDLWSESPRCFKTVLEDISVSLYGRSGHLRQASVSPFVKSDESVKSRSGSPQLYVPFRISKEKGSS